MCVVPPIAPVRICRRGWKSLDTPTGWAQIIRGPRPPSVQWPPVGLQSRQPVQHGPCQSPTNRPTSVQAKSLGLRPFQDPSVRAAAAKERLSKLEIALSAMDGMEGRGGHGAQCLQTGVGGSARHPDRRPGESASHSQEVPIWRSWIPSVRPSSQNRLEELRAQQTMT